MSTASAIKKQEQAMTPQEEIVLALRNNAVEDLEKLMQDKTNDTNQTLQRQGGNTALHIACMNGSDDCLELLLKTKRPDARILNDFEFTPLDCALYAGKITCAELLLQNFHWPIGYLWFRCFDDKFTSKHCRPTSEKTNHYQYNWNRHFDWDDEIVDTRYLEHVADILKFLIKATPNNLLQKHMDNIADHLTLLSYRNDDQMQDILKVLFFTGNTLKQSDYDLYVTWRFGFNTRKSFLDWHNSYKNQPQVLQHYCRLAVRRNLSDNLFYQIQLLPLPQKIKDYLMFK
jgi:hypothetical protein